MSNIRKFIDYFHRYVFTVIVRFMCSIFLGVGATVPPLENDILSKSATNLAEQIRKKQVNLNRS